MALIKDTLYAKYLKDRSGIEILEDDLCFILYKITGKELFLRDISIDESARRTGKFRDMIQKLTDIGLKNGCEVISANIDVKDPNRHITLTSSIKVGFVLERADHDILLIVKQIAGVN